MATIQKNAIAEKALEINNLIGRVLAEADEYTEDAIDVTIKNIESLQYLVETYKIVRFG